MKEKRKLEDLHSVGPQTCKDLALLGITKVEQLIKKEACDLYRKLCFLTRSQQDPCVEDVFSAAIAQARDLDLPEEQKDWAYWSKVRKQRVPRCAWVPLNNQEYIDYHDSEWGVPVYDDRGHFEFLILEAAQAGLSWEIILKRRKEYAKAFAGFDWIEVAKFDKTKVEELLKSSGIVKNRAKIESVIENAKRFAEIVEEFGSFTKYIWQFVNNAPLQGKRRSIIELPVQTPESEALSKDLKKRGFTFVGPTVMYAHMQATGLVNDHTVDCFCYKKRL